MNATEMVTSSNWSRFSEACRSVLRLSLLVEVQSELYHFQLPLRADVIFVTVRYVCDGIVYFYRKNLHCYGAHFLSWTVLYGKFQWDNLTCHAGRWDMLALIRGRSLPQ